MVIMEWTYNNLCAVPNYGTVVDVYSLLVGNSICQQLAAQTQKHQK